MLTDFFTKPLQGLAFRKNAGHNPKSALDQKLMECTGVLAEREKMTGLK